MMGNITGILSSKPDKALEPKVVLITGASAGMGKEMALTMIQRGHTVYGGARRVEKMQDIVDAGGSAIKLDVTNHQQVTEAVKRIIREQGCIDVLVNNAGISKHGPAEEVPLNKVRDVFEVNFFGLVDLTQQVIPHMRKANKGLIVNVTSIAGKTYNMFTSSYTASKHALEGWSDCLRNELSFFNIKVAIMEPGLIKTDIADALELVVPDDTAYKRFTDHKYKKKPEFPSAASHPAVVANALVHATESSNPKRRYVMGFLAVPLLLMRAWLGDAFCDYFVTAWTRHIKK